MYLYIPLELIQLLAFPKEYFSCITTYEYFVCYIWCLLSVQGRKTTRNMYKYCFFFKKHVSSWCRFLTEYVWDYNEIIHGMFKQLLEIFINELTIHGALLGCYDTTLIAKDSKKVQGTQKWNTHSTNADRGSYIIGHHWGALGLIGLFKKQFICFVLTFRLITGKKQNYQWKCGEKGIERLLIWDVAHAQIFQLNEWAKEYNLPIRIVVDAYFSNNPFIQPLMDKNIHVISRLRDNAVAYLDPEPQPKGKRGPKPKHGKKIKVYDLLKMNNPETVEVFLYGKHQKIDLVTAELTMLDLTKKVKVVVTKTAKGKHTAFISTDLTLTAAQIIEIYGSRFSIELSFRDMKQHLGLEDYQHQDILPVLRYLHVIAVAFNIGKTLLLKNSDSKWLNIDDEVGGTPWTSTLSLLRLRTCLKRYCLGKLISNDSAKHEKPEKLELDKEAIMRIAS